MNDEPSIKEMVELWLVCSEFIKKKHISCPESIYQTDHVIQGSYGFVEEICEIVGYADRDNE